MKPDDVPGALDRLGLIVDVLAIMNRHHTWIDQVWSRARFPHVSHARHEIATLLRDRLGWSYPAIGQFMGRDHTTIMASVALVRGQRQAEAIATERAARRALPDLELELARGAA